MAPRNCCPFHLLFFDHPGCHNRSWEDSRQLAKRPFEAGRYLPFKKQSMRVTEIKTYSSTVDPTFTFPALIYGLRTLAREAASSIVQEAHGWVDKNRHKAVLFSIPQQRVAE